MDANYKNVTCRHDYWYFISQHQREGKNCAIPLKPSCSLKNMISVPLME